MSRVLLALVFLVIPDLSSAAETLAGSMRALGQGQVLRGRFVQERRLKGFSAPLRSEGRFVLASGAGLIWKAEKPFAIVTVITADGLVQETNGTETAHLPATRLPFLTKLYDMLGGALAGDWRALESRFAVTRKGDDRQWEIALTPRQSDNSAGMPIRSITLKGGDLVDYVEILRPDGDLDRLAFVEQAVSTGPLSDDEAALLKSVNR